MAGIQERGVAAHIARMKVAGLTTATLLYQRKAGGAPIDLTGLAWRGGTRFFRQPTEAGQATAVFRERDYFIPVADLTVSGVPVVPVRGDRISEVLNGVTTTFEITPQFGEPEVRFEDNEHTLYMVHVKQVNA